MADKKPLELLAEGKHIRLLSKEGWEYSERTRAKYAVVILALTPGKKILLVEQFRPPMNANCIEMPAGLVGDEEGEDLENIEAAALRELLEETGYQASRIKRLAGGPPSPGLSNEHIILVEALGLERKHGGGGVGNEDIRVHEVSLEEAPARLAEWEKRGILIDPKVYAGLYFASRNEGHPLA